MPIIERIFLVLRPLNELMLKIWFSGKGHLLARCRIEREKFYHGPGLEPGPLALQASALITTLSRASADP